MFKEKLNVNEYTINLITNGIADLNQLNYCSIQISWSELKCAINSLMKSNVAGHDSISSNMILNTNDSFLRSKILYFFRFMLKYGVIPNGFNMSNIISISKDKSKPQNDLSNLRPISISNVFSQLFERIISYKMPEISA